MSLQSIGFILHFENQKGSPSSSTTSIVLVLVVSVLLDYRRLRDVELFKDDPIVLRLLGLTSMPSVSTISRQLGALLHHIDVPLLWESYEKLKCCAAPGVDGVR